MAVMTHAVVPTADDRTRAHFMSASLRTMARSNSLVCQPGEEGRLDDEIAPLGVGFGGRLGCAERFQRVPALFKAGDVCTNADQHVAKFAQLGSIADRLPVPWDDDGRVPGESQVGIGGSDRPVYASAGRVVDEGIDAVPEGIASVQNI